MKQVQTVLGPVPIEQLGVTLMNEHLVIGFPGWVFDPFARFDRVRITNLLIDRLCELKDLGVTTFVDPCPIELARNPGLAAEVSEGSGLHIICATGLYTNRLGIPVYFRQRSIDEIAEIFVRELTEGIGSTGIRAGLITCATGRNEITPHEEKCLRAAGRAHRATGAPIFTYTESATMGNEQLNILASERVDFGRVVIGHSCCTADLAYHLSLLDRGVFLGFDRFGLEREFPDRLRVAALAGLVALGRARQIVLANSAVGCFLGRPLHRTSESQRGLEHWSFVHLFTDVLPKLRDIGIGETEIRTMLVDNPRRFFGGSP